MPALSPLDPLWSTLELSLRVATVSTLLGMAPATLLGYWMAHTRRRLRTWVSALTALPLVMPPTAMGYLLLQVFAFDGLLGRGTLGVELGVLMTWRAAVVATCVMSLPLIVRTTRVAFETIDPNLARVARSLGHTPAEAFVKFTLPIARRGILAGGILGFTRALGEFGATVTIAGNIPGQTSTLAAAIYSAQEVGDHSQARILIGVSIALGIGASVMAEVLSTPDRSTRRKRSRLAHAEPLPRSSG